MNSNVKNSITLLKDGQRYIFRFDASSRKALLGVFGRFARDPKLNFSWHDAAVLAGRIRVPARGSTASAKRFPSELAP